MNKSIFKATDIRGIYPTHFNETVARIVAKACIHMFPEGEVIVAHDVRYGSMECAQIAKEELENEAKKLGKNFSVREIGLASTPMFYFFVNYFKSVGGIMVTASHNPKNYNGMKVVKKDAIMIPGTDLLNFITKNNLA